MHYLYYSPELKASDNCQDKLTLVSPIAGILGEPLYENLCTKFSNLIRRRFFPGLAGLSSLIRPSMESFIG